MKIKNYFLFVVFSCYGFLQTRVIAQESNQRPMQNHSVLDFQSDEADQLFLKAKKIRILNPQKADSVLASILSSYPFHADTRIELEMNKHKSRLEKEFGSVSSDVKTSRELELFQASCTSFEQDPEKSIAFLVEVLYLNPAHESARADLTILLRNRILKEMENLKKEEEEKKKNKESAALLFQSSSEFFEKDPIRASEILRQVIALDPEHQDAKADLKILEASVEAMKKASQEEQALKNKELARSLFLSSVEFFEKDPQKAVDILKQVILLDSEHKDAKEDLKILEASLAALQKTTRKWEPDEQKSAEFFNKAQFYYESSPKYAIELLQEALKWNPAHKSASEDIQILKSRLISEKQKSQQPVDLREKAGILFLQAGKFYISDRKKAITMLEEVLTLDPDHKSAQEDLKGLKAISDFESSDEIRPEDKKKEEAGLLFLKAAKIYTADRQKAIEMLKEVLRLDPDHQSAKIDLESLLKAK